MNEQHPTNFADLPASASAAMTPSPILLDYYLAIEHASEQMLDAARTGDWNQVVRLEGACALLISQLRQAAKEHEMGQDERQLKGRVMKRILINDAKIRNLAEPWLEDLDDLLVGQPKMMH